MKIKVPDTGDEATNSLLVTAWQDGADSARTEVLTWLENEYMTAPRADDKTILNKARSKEEEAILELAKKLGIFIRSNRGKDTVK